MVTVLKQRVEGDVKQELQPVQSDMEAGGSQNTRCVRWRVGEYQQEHR